MNGKYIKTTLLFATALIIATGILVYTNTTKKLMKKQAYAAVQQTALQIANELESSIEYAESSIKLVSHFLTTNMTEREIKDPNKMLSGFNDNIPFDIIEYIRWDGFNMMNSIAGEQPFDASERVYYREGIQGKSGIWPNYTPKVAKEVLLNFYTPLYYDNEIVGVITGAMGGQSRIAPKIKASFLGTPIVGFLCDKDFKIISTTCDDLRPGLDISVHTDIPLLTDVIEHANNNDNSPFKYINNKKDGICCVTPLENTDWYIVMIVYPKILAASLQSVSKRMFIIAIFIIVILLGYLFLHLTINNKISKKIEKEQLNVIDAFGIVYENVYLIDMKKEDLFVYKMSDKIYSNYGNTFPKQKYSDAIELYVNKEVLEEDKYLFEPINTVEKVSKIFKEKREYSFVYRVVRDSKILYFQCLLLKSTNSTDQFVAGFKDVNDLMKKQMTDQQRMSELLDMQTTQLSILGSLAEIYSTVHLLDLSQDVLAEITVTREVRNLFDSVKALPIKEQMEKIMKASVVPEHLEEMLAFTNLATVARRLKGRKMLTKEFRGVFHGWCRASFISVESDENGKVIKLLFATQIIDDEKRREEKLINTAYYDELTGVFNRHAYEETLSEYRANPPENNFIYISFDVNGLKKINDSLGHAAGDELIKGSAEIIQQTFGKFGKVFRTGGDEFQAIIFASKEELESILKDFENVQQSWTGKLVDSLRISAGCCSKKENPDLSISEMVKLADDRMYKAKSIYYSSVGIDRRAEQAAFEVLCNSYTKILKVDLVHDEYSIIQMNSDEQMVEKGYSERISTWLHDFGTSGQVHSDDVEHYLRETDIEYIKKYFIDGNKILSIQYKRKIGNDFYKVMMEMIPAKEYTPENQLIYLYVKNIDKNE